MRQRNEVELVKKYFHYLFDSYGFTIIDVRYFEEFSNWTAVLVSDKCRLRFVEDRGTVMLAVGPLWDPPGWDSGSWFELPAVTTYLNKRTFIWDYELGPTEPQLERLAGILRPYMDLICATFNLDSFPEHEGGLINISNEHNKDL